MFYSKPVLLSRESHGKMRITPHVSFGFATQLNSLYVAGAEFSEVCKEYPIVFTRVAENRIAPVAMLGLRENENLFVTHDARQTWDGSYVPAFVRRYPFVLAELPGAQLGVCIDEAFPGLGSQGGEALFTASGANTPFLQNALDFLNRFQVEHMRTDTFCDRLKSLDLFTEMNAKADLFDGTSFTVNGLMVIDEQKLLALSDAKALEVFRAGELAWIYAHLLSLGNMNRLVDRLAARKRSEGAQAPEEVSALATEAPQTTDATPAAEPAPIATAAAAPAKQQTDKSEKVSPSKA